MSDAIFRAIWPITDERMTVADLIREALPEVPLLAGQAGARLIDGGQFITADSRRVPGSGRVTPRVLIYQARAERIEPRAYRKAS